MLRERTYFGDCRMAAQLQFDKPPALKDQVYNLMREQIRMGALNPEDRLVDAAIAKEMRISRTPVREALQLLVHEGLLDTSSRGFKLLELSQAEVGHLFELRALLEPALVAQAAVVPDKASVARLFECVDRASAAVQDNTPKDFNTAIYQFFEGITDMCPNRAMVRSVLLYHDRLAQLRVRMMAPPSHRKLAIEGFATVAHAIADGDAQKARLAQVAHIEAGVAACRDLGLL